MITVADINVLLPILFANHSLQPTAWQWWEQQPDATVGLCLLSRLGTLRMLTKVMGGNPVTPAQAIAAWDTLAADPRCVWLEADSRHETTFRRLLANRPPSPNLWTDAWLAALADANGFRLTSFDSDFCAFGLRNLELLKP